MRANLCLFFWNESDEHELNQIFTDAFISKPFHGY